MRAVVLGLLLGGVAVAYYYYVELHPRIARISDPASQARPGRPWDATARHDPVFD